MVQYENMNSYSSGNLTQISKGKEEVIKKCQIVTFMENSDLVRKEVVEQTLKEMLHDSNSRLSELHKYILSSEKVVTTLEKQEYKQKKRNNSFKDRYYSVEDLHMKLNLSKRHIIELTSELSTMRDLVKQKVKYEKKLKTLLKESVGMLMPLKSYVRKVEKEKYYLKRQLGGYQIRKADEKSLQLLDVSHIDSKYTKKLDNLTNKRRKTMQRVHKFV